MPQYFGSYLLLLQTSWDSISSVICVWFRSSGISHTTPVTADPPPSHTSAALFAAAGTASSSAGAIAITAAAEPLPRDGHPQELMGSEFYQHPSSVQGSTTAQLRCHPAQKGGCCDRAAWSIYVSIHPKPKPCLEIQHRGIQNSWSLFYTQWVKAPNLGCKISHSPQTHLPQCKK